MSHVVVRGIGGAIWIVVEKILDALLDGPTAVATGQLCTVPAEIVVNWNSRNIYLRRRRFIRPPELPDIHSQTRNGALPHLLKI